VILRLSPRVQQIAAVIIPLAAAAVSLGIVYPAWGRYTKLMKTVSRQSKELQGIKNSPLPPPDPVLTAAPDGPEESAQFLGQITALSLASRCKLIGLDVPVQLAAVAVGPLRPVRTTVQVEGRFPDIREFVRLLNSAPRLFAVASIDITKRSQDVSSKLGVVLPRASVQVERYIVVGPAAAAETPPASGGG